MHLSVFKTVSMLKIGRWCEYLYKLRTFKKKKKKSFDLVSNMLKTKMVSFIKLWGLFVIQWWVLAEIDIDKTIWDKTISNGVGAPGGQALGALNPGVPLSGLRCVGRFVGPACSWARRAWGTILGYFFFPPQRLI